MRGSTQSRQFHDASAPHFHRFSVLTFSTVGLLRDSADSAEFRQGFSNSSAEFQQEFNKVPIWFQQSFHRPSAGFRHLFCRVSATPQPGVSRVTGFSRGQSLSWFVQGWGRASAEFQHDCTKLQHSFSNSFSNVSAESQMSFSRVLAGCCQHSFGLDFSRVA